MKLKLSTSLQQRQEQRQEHRVTQAQRLEARQEMKAEMAQLVNRTIEDLGEHGDVNPKAMLERAYDSTVDNLSEALKVILTGQGIKANLVEILLAEPTKILANLYPETVINKLYQDNRGEFKTPDNMGKLDAPSPMIVDAYKNPKKIKREIEKLQRLMKESGTSGRGMMDEIRRHQDALTIAELISNDVEITSHFLNLIMCVSIEDENQIRNFLADFIIFRNLIKRGEVSGAVVEKMIEGMFYILRKSAVKKYKRNNIIDERITNPVLNGIGKIMLVALGVVDKGLFQTRRGKVDMSLTAPEDVEIIQRHTGMTVRQVMENYGLGTNDGEFFYFRSYKTLNTKPTMDTDNQVRDFITGTIREDSEELLEKMRFREKYEKLIHEIYTEQGDKRILIGDFIKEIFQDEEFMGFLRRQIAEKYVPALQELI